MVNETYMYMKRVVVTIILLLFVIIQIKAQEKKYNITAKKFHIGIEISPSVDWLNMKNDGYKTKGVIMGFKAGIPVEINLLKTSNWFLFTTGLKIDHTGGKIEYFGKNLLTEQETTVCETHRSTYLYIPTALKLKTPLLGKSKARIIGQFGLIHGFNLHSTVLVSAIYQNIYYANINPLKYTKSFVFRESVFAGLGVEYDISDRINIFAVVNYTYSISNYFNKKAIIETVYENGHVNSVDLTLGVSF